MILLIIEGWSLIGDDDGGESISDYWSTIRDCTMQLTFMMRQGSQEYDESHDEDDEDLPLCKHCQD